MELAILLLMLAAFAAVITYRIACLNRLMNDLEQHLEAIRNQGCKCQSNNKEKENK